MGKPINVSVVGASARAAVSAVMVNEVCATCRFYLFQGGKLGTCGRYPPLAIMGMEVPMSYWCGEWHGPI